MLMWQLKDDGVDIRCNTIPVSFVKDGDKIKVSVQNTSNGELTEIEVDTVLISSGR